MKIKLKRNIQCCGSGTGYGTVRIRNFWPDLDPVRNRNKHFGSGFESGTETGSEINQKKEPCIQAKISWFQRCGIVNIFDGSGPSSDFWNVMVPVPTFKKLWAGWFHTIVHIYVTDSWVLRAHPEIHRQNRQSARLLHQSSELRLPHPLTRRRVCSPLLWFRGGYTLTAGEGVGGSQFRRGDRHCGNLGTYLYMHFVFTGMGEGHHAQTICKCVGSSKIANFLRTFVSKSQSWWRAALKMRMRKNL